MIIAPRRLLEPLVGSPGDRAQRLGCRSPDLPLLVPEGFGKRSTGAILGFDTQPPQAPRRGFRDLERASFASLRVSLAHRARAVWAAFSSKSRRSE
jgi:hypothetical protein